MLAQRISGRVRDIGETGVRVPAYVRRVIRRCLERSPARRYQGARAAHRGPGPEARCDRPSRCRRRWLALAVALLAGHAPAWSASGASTACRSCPRTPAGHRRRRCAAPPPVTRWPCCPSPTRPRDPALAWTGTGHGGDDRREPRGEPGPARPRRAARRADVARSAVAPPAATTRACSAGSRSSWRWTRLVAGASAGRERPCGWTCASSPCEPGGALTTRHLDAESADEGGLFRVVGGLGERLRQELGAGPAEHGEPGARDHLPGGGQRLPGRPGADAARRLHRRRPRPGAGGCRRPRIRGRALERLSETYESLGYHDKALAAAETRRERRRAGGDTAAIPSRARGWRCCEVIRPRRRRATPGWPSATPTTRRSCSTSPPPRGRRARSPGPWRACRRPPPSTGTIPGPGSCWARTPS